MSEITFIKLKDLVDSSFTVEKVFYPKYKMWDNETKKMLVSDNWQKGYRKIYGVQSDKGSLDLSSGQLGNMLESVSKSGEASIIGRTFTVKSNGKEGMDIRYFINPKPQAEPGGAWEQQREKFEAKKDVLPKDEDIDEPIDTSEIPF